VVAGVCRWIMLSWSVGRGSATNVDRRTGAESGRDNQADQIQVELHQPADMPTFILVNWPTGPSVASPDNFSDLVAAVFRILADARVALSRMRGERRTK
jgi:hypothetical protein